MPHRGLEAAKTRLGEVLDSEEREALAAELLRRVLGVAATACADLVVITPSPALAGIVQPAGARLVVQRGLGLNEGLDQARAAALADGVRTLVVLHGDLPNLHPEDVAALCGALPADADRGIAIAPDRPERGTNGLVVRPPDLINFRFGTDSFAAHLAEARSAGVEPVVVRRPGLAFDLDTPEDLARWLELGDAA